MYIMEQSAAVLHPQFSPPRQGAPRPALPRFQRPWIRDPPQCAPMSRHQQQQHQADFSRYWGPRLNGWKHHALRFHTNIIASESSSTPFFRMDGATGTITVLRDSTLLTVEVWWRGKAPWDSLISRC